MLAQREHDYFAETVICANCYIVAIFYFYGEVCIAAGVYDVTFSY